MKKNYFFILISLFVFNLLTTNGNTKYIVRPHNQAIIHNNMGAQFMAQQDLDKAIFEFKTAIEISPEYVEAWNNLGLAYKYKKDYNKAVDTFKQAIKIDNRFPAALTGLGGVYINLGEYNKAIDYFEQAVSANKKYADAYYNMGIAYKKLADMGQSNQLQKAIDSYRKATDANPSHYAASIDLGHIYMSQGKYEDALIRFKVSAENNPNNPNVWFALSQLYQKMGNPAKAQEATNKALSLKPDSAEGHMMMGLHYLDEKNFPLAEQEFRAAMNLAPNNGLSYFYLALLATRQGDNALAKGSQGDANNYYQKSIQGFTKALELDSKNVDAAYNLGYNYYRLGNKTQAKEWFEKALVIQSNHFKTLLAFGALEGEMGNTSRARELLCRVIREAPSDMANEKQQASQLVGNCR